MIYIFIRETHFYPISGINSDAEVLDHVALNPGTIRVEDVTGRVVWDEKRDPRPTNQGGHA